jgi:hypothetical protein
VSNKPHTYSGDLAHLPSALIPLTEQPRWVVWHWEVRTTKGGKEKWTKPPRQARDPSRNARSNDPSTWGTYADAVAAVAAGAADGIGFMLKDSNIGAIDLDHCRDPENAEVDTWAEQLQIEADGAYQEVTVSGGGLRIIGTVSGSEVHRKFTFDRKTGAGVELYRNTARYITVSGIEIGSCAKLPSLDLLIDRVLARHGAPPPDELDFNLAGRQLDYDDLIAKGAPEGERSELFQAVVWHLASQGQTADQITDQLARHPKGIGAKYADRLHAEVTRSYKKWRDTKRTAVTGDTEHIDNPWPQIFVTPGELPKTVNEAEDALLLLKGHEIYQRGGLVVRPVMSRTKPVEDMQNWHLIPVVRPYLVERLTCAARFLRYDGRAKGWVAVDAPEKVADAYLSRQGGWRLPPLAGITNAPFLRADGSACEAPGYDPASGLLYKPDGRTTFPPIPRQPTRDDGRAALAEIERLIESFPFVTDADRSVALSAILTALDRRAMVTAPLHAFTARAAGTGKSMLVDIAATLATGRPMPVISQGRTEEELEKRLGAALLAGDPAISLDNCEHPLQSAFLCQVLTQQQLNIRPLGASVKIETPVNCTVFATGNNLTVVGDLTRRTILCSLDAGCENPERRHFDIDPVAVAREHRGRLVAAALTVLRAWHIAGEEIERPSFGSFEDWSYRIRAPLLWLGQADPCNTTMKVQTDDPRLLALATVMAQWREHLGINKSHTIQQAINYAITANDFHVALLNVAQGKAGNMVSNDRLGRWLRSVEGRVIEGLAFKRVGISFGYPMWSLACRVSV